QRSPPLPGPLRVLRVGSAMVSTEKYLANVSGREQWQHLLIMVRGGGYCVRPSRWCASSIRGSSELTVGTSMNPLTLITGAFSCSHASTRIYRSGGPAFTHPRRWAPVSIRNTGQKQVEPAPSSPDSLRRSSHD